MITIYSTPDCPWCKRAKAYFDSLKISYTDHDVIADQEKAQEMFTKSKQLGVPVIDIAGTIIVGFNKDKIDAALARH